jgi:trk system potassium uptake protein TrkA
MYIIIVGGGKVGYYLARSLLNAAHEVLIVERDVRTAERIAETLGEGVVLRGAGDEAATLQSAGAKRADVVIAVTGDDEDNLIVCQVAKRRFNVPRTIARVNNPKNEYIFSRLGIDMTVSATNVILSLIEQEIPTHPLVHLVSLRQAGMEICELIISRTSPVVGQRVGDLRLPPETTLALIVRDSSRVFPQPTTIVEEGDRIIALVAHEQEPVLHRLMLGTEMVE